MAGSLNDVPSPTTKGSYSYCFEYDSLQIVNSLRDSSVGQIIEDIKALFLTITEVSHVRRQANGITHRLARYGLSLSNDCNWVESPTVFIMDLLVEQTPQP